MFEQGRFKTFLFKYVKFVKLTLQVDISNYLNQTINLYEYFAITKGPLFAVKLFKQFYDITLRNVTSNDYTPIKFFKSNSSGYPKNLEYLEPLNKGTLNERRASLSILQVIKLVEVKDQNFSIQTIIGEPLIPKDLDPNKQLEVGNYLSRFITKFGNNNLKIDLNKFLDCYKQTLESMFPDNRQNERRNRINKLSSLHISGRNGPNGPGLITVVLDYDSLANPRDGNTELLNSILEISKMTNNHDLLSLLKGFDEEVYTFSSKTNAVPIHSKISLKREPWGKTRPFAICDYFSQSALRGFHKFLFEELEELPEDGTFKQDSVSEAVRKWTESKPSYKTRIESADLSSATDRIPVEVQAEIVAKIAGKAFARQWLNIATEREFKLPNSDNKVKYKTGNLWD